MYRTGIVLLICFCACFSDHADMTALVADEHRPNILVVLCDDLGYGDLACYGHPLVKTLNLDKFATEGMRLTSCYSVAPNCSPVRCGLMTGRTPFRVGMHNWISDESPMHLRKREITIATLLRLAGGLKATGSQTAKANLLKPAQLGAAISTDARNALAALKALGPKTREAWFRLLDKISNDAQNAVVANSAPKGGANRLVHLTDDAGQFGKANTGTINGSHGIFAIPAYVARESTALKVLRTGLSPGKTKKAIPITDEALDLFKRPIPVGPYSAGNSLAESVMHLPEA